MKGVYNRVSGKELSERLQHLSFLQKMPLDKKISISIRVIKEGLLKGASCLLFSGGKDSLALLYLLKESGGEFMSMHNNTGLSGGRWIQHVRACHTPGYVETSSEDPFQMWERTGYYPILTKRGFTAFKKKYPDLKISPVQCCYQLKEKPANKVLKEKRIKAVFWGNRAGESNRRKLGFCDNGFIFQPKKYPWWQVYPLQHWVTEDVNRYVALKSKTRFDFVTSCGREGGCWACANDIQYNPNTMIRLYSSDNKRWRDLMVSGFGQQILIAKGAGHLSLLDVLTKSPAFLLHIGKKNAKD